MGSLHPQDANPWPHEAAEEPADRFVSLRDPAHLVGWIGDTRHSALSLRWEQHLGLVNCPIMKSTLPLLADND
jgi:hypothetical protein